MVPDLLSNTWEEKKEKKHGKIERAILHAVRNIFALETISRMFRETTHTQYVGEEKEFCL